VRGGDGEMGDGEMEWWGNGMVGIYGRGSSALVSSDFSGDTQRIQDAVLALVSKTM
jgi:hypothetical protein